MLEKLFNFNYPLVPFEYPNWQPITKIEEALVTLSVNGSIDLSYNHVDIIKIIKQITQAQTYAKIGMILAAVAVLVLIVVIINQIRIKRMLRQILAGAPAKEPVQTPENIKEDIEATEEHPQ